MMNARKNILNNTETLTIFFENDLSEQNRDNIKKFITLPKDYDETENSNDADDGDNDEPKLNTAGGE